MGGVTEAARVWISRLGTARPDVEGTLTLTPTHLEFRHAGGPEDARVPLSHFVGPDDARIPLNAVRKVRRPLGAPVLEVEYVAGGEPVRVAFFFAQPPPVTTDGLWGRERRRRSQIAFVLQRGESVIETVKEWRGAVRAAVAGAGRTAGEDVQGTR